MLSRLCCQEAVPLAPAHVYPAAAASGVRALRAAATDAWPDSLRALEIAHLSPQRREWTFPDASAHVLVAASGFLGTARFRLEHAEYAVAPGGAAVARSSTANALQWQAGGDASCILHLAHRPRNGEAGGRWTPASAPPRALTLGAMRLSLLFGDLVGGELHGAEEVGTTVVEVAQPPGYSAAMPVPPGGVALLWIRSGLLRFGSMGADRTLAAGALGQVNGGARKGFIHVEPIRGPAAWTYVAVALA